MPDLVDGPWCTLGKINGAVKDDWGFKWVGINSEYWRLFACDDFWKHFDWNRPKKGEEMRLVFSLKRVVGAQKMLVCGELYDRCFVVGEGELLGTYSALDDLLTALQPEEVPEFYVWWWPEYRMGRVK